MAVLKKLTLFMALVVFILSNTSMYAGDEVSDYFQVKVRSGDGIATLLSRYKLGDEACNMAKFCELNNLQETDLLYTHKKYLLPIVLFKYNDKSIRSSIGVDDMEKALRIKNYNEDLFKNGLKKKHFFEDKVLMVPFHELGCNEAKGDQRKVMTNDKIVTTDEENKAEVVNISKSKAGVVVNPLFGKEYESVELEDRSLSNQVFYIISGHGGPDPGAMCDKTDVNMCEDEYAYDVSLRLARNLTQHGAIVHMIVQDKNDGIRDEAYLECDQDEKMCNGKCIPLNQLERLKARTDAVNVLYSKYKKQKVKSQKLIEIHVDSRSEEHRQDVFFYHFGEGQGEKMANNLHDVFDSKYQAHQKDRGYYGYVGNRGLFTLRKVKPGAVYVELANIRNTEDHKRLIINTNRQALANWLFEGLIK